MRVVIDLEANGIDNPTQIWCIVCKDIDTNELNIFRNVTTDNEERLRFLSYASKVDVFIGHHMLGFDYPHLSRLINFHVEDIASHCYDTFILSKLIDYPRPKHSIESYGIEFDLPKCKNHYVDFFTKWSQELEDYCVRDVEICHRIFLKYLHIINDPVWAPAIEVENHFQHIANDLHSHGFGFNSKRATTLLSKVKAELAELDVKILEAFPPRLKLIREITPRVTKHGTLSRIDFKFITNGDLSEYNGGPFCRCSWNTFNPASHKQVVEVLNKAGWSPIDKTETHKDIERETNRLKFTKQRSTELDTRLQECYTLLERLREFGWKINENNLATLPPKAPSPAKTLAKRILLESRRRTLTEWLGLVHPETNRIHGQFQGIGAWTHRTATQKPNVQNIPTGTKLFANEMRSLWQAPRNRLLVGVDADSIQFRIAAHYINDPALIKGIVEGKKSDGTDPHSFNNKLLQPFCPNRDASKRVLFSLILGGSPKKFAEIMKSSTEEGEEARDRLYKQYPGLVTLKQEIVVEDARRGWFRGLDGRKVKVPGDTLSERKHLMPSGYLQNGEAVVMKHATVLWSPKLKDLDSFLVNLVHDEWQTETPNDMEIALQVAKMQADSLREIGEKLKLNCPLAGSYWSEDLKDYTIGVNWLQTH